MLMKSVEERLAIAKQARAQSESEKGEKSMADMDVVESAVAEAVKAAGVDLVIHGHTHKPAAHMQNGYERWVIPDWELDGPDAPPRAAPSPSSRAPDPRFRCSKTSADSFRITCRTVDLLSRRSFLLRQQ